MTRRLLNIAIFFVRSENSKNNKILYIEHDEICFRNFLFILSLIGLCPFEQNKIYIYIKLVNVDSIVINCKHARVGGIISTEFLKNRRGIVSNFCLVDSLTVGSNVFLKMIK